jgi:hypothetical protein
MTELPGALHFSAEQLAAFLDGRLTTDERRRALAHFAACGACRREMAATRQLLGASRPRRRLPTVGFMAAIAAVLAAIIVSRTPPPDGDVMSPVRAGERAIQPDRAPRLVVVSPGERAMVDSAIVFRWRSAGTDATYRLVLLDGAGAVAWEKTTADTTATLPREIALTRGAQYFWLVDAQLADGGSANGGTHRFITR